MDFKDEWWLDVCMEKDPETALNMFMEKLTKLADKYAPLRKRTVKHNNAPWLNDELKALITQRDNAKMIVNQSGCLTDRELYWKLRNKVTKLNKNTKREYRKSVMLEMIARKYRKHKMKL